MAHIGNFLDADKTRIVDMIDKAGTTKSLPRPYLGMSQLGDECLRKLWLYFRWTAETEIDGRVNRIFATGHNAEAFMIRDLEAIGVKTWDTLDAQAGFSAINNHCRGHSDGLAKNVPGAEKALHILEFKTSSDKYFKSVVKKGVKQDKPLHYAQMMLYAHFSGATRCLYMVYNKNTSAYYTERVDANEEFAKDLIFKAGLIIHSEDVNDFKRIGSGTPSYYGCKFCDFKEVCFSEVKAHKNCRTCVYADVLDDGKWGCGKHDLDDVSAENQAKGCGSHEYLDCLKEG